VNSAFASESGTNKFDSLILSLPSQNWAIEVRSPGFKIEDGGIRMNLQDVYFYATNGKTKNNISIYIEKAEKAGDSDVCRETYWKRLENNGAKERNVKFSKYGETSISEYELAAFYGAYKHLNAYMVKDGFWIDIHISNSDITLKDTSKYYSILENIQIIEKYPKADPTEYSSKSEECSSRSNFVKLLTLVEKRNTNNGAPLAAPGMKHSLSLDMSNFKILDEKSDPRWNYKFYYARDEINKINMTIDIMNPVSKEGSKAYREIHMKQMERDGYKRSDIKKYESNDKAYLEFMINEHDGKQVFQKNLVEYVSCEDMWACVQVSTMPYKEEDYAKLKKVLDSARIIDRYGQDCYSYWNLGNDSYAFKKDYNKAIESYEKAREIESKNPQLDKYAWIIMIDNLGMAYGMTGKLDKAIEIFNAGIKRYPEYPLFYYCLACAYAEKRDLETALVHLENAYKRRGHTFFGEKPSNPMTDNSFKPFWDNEKLKSLVSAPGS
jgi:tetratricopeptide (TPR) repeat protein